MLTEVIDEISGMDPDTWQTRVVSNKYPALQPGSVVERRYTRGPYVALPAYGRHEVIIESSKHNRKLSNMLTGEVDTIIETYHKRYVEVMREPQNMLTLIFRNYGPRAGTSLRHPHSQLVSTPVVPRSIRWSEDEAQRYFDRWGCCLYCDVLEYEAKEKHRVLTENESFLAFVPFAAAVPCEMWIMPKQHQADFGNVEDEQKADLSGILKDCLSRLSSQLDDPDYNYIINTAARYRTGEPHLHWFLRIWPRITIPAGFEVGSGMRINTSMPENDAALLRGER